MKITRFVIHKATLRWRDLVLLEIHTDAGLVGIGEGSLHTRATLVEEALRWLEPHFVGQDFGSIWRPSFSICPSARCWWAPTATATPSMGYATCYEPTPPP